MKESIKCQKEGSVGIPSSIGKPAFIKGLKLSPRNIKKRSISAAPSALLSFFSFMLKSVDVHKCGFPVNARLLKFHYECVVSHWNRYIFANMNLENM